MRRSYRLSTMLACACLFAVTASLSRAQTTSQLGAPGEAEIAARQATAKEVRRQKVATLVADALKLYDATQFREAADLLRQATIIDPQDEIAALNLRLVMDKIMSARLEEYARGSGSYQVPPDPYPPFGPTNDAARTEPAPPSDSPANRAARDRLEENLKEITADNQGFEKVLNFLRDNMGANIFVNWTALAAVNIDRNSPVTVSLKEVPFRKALTTIFSIVDGGMGTLTYTIDDGIIVISTKEDFNSAKYQLIRVYDIRDLLVVPAEAARGKPENDLFGVGYDRTTAPPATAPGGLFSDSGPGTQPESTASLLRRKKIQDIIDTLTKTVAPDTWRDKGGTIGSIRELNGQLIVNQTVDNQVAIFNLLNYLRDARIARITLESRILLVPGTLLDSLHIGWTSQSDLPLPSNPAAPAAPADGKFTAAILDNAALVQLLQAAQAERRTITITAPRCTLYDAMEGTLACTAPRRYLSGYSRSKPPIEPTRFLPAYAFVDTGLAMAFQPHISPDAKSLAAHITLTRTLLARLDRAAVPDLPADSKLEIETPVLATAAGTMVLALPDAGTALINLGTVPADYLRNAPDNVPADAPKPDLQMLLLLRPTIVPKSVEGQNSDIPTKPAVNPTKP